jgi:DNA replication protein DnaC
MTYNIATLNPMKRFWLAKNSNIPIRFQGWDRQSILDDMGSFPEEIDDWLDDMSKGNVILNPGGVGVTGVGLLFDGAPGMGKTTHAVIAATQFILNLPDEEEEMNKVLRFQEGHLGQKSRVVRYYTFPEFLALKKATFDADLDERRKLNSHLEGLHGRSSEDYLNVRILIIDDLGKEKGSKYEDVAFDELLRARYDRGLPTLVTTNVNRDNWAIQYGDAMGSFAFEAFKQVRIVSKDLRK